MQLGVDENKPHLSQKNKDGIIPTILTQGSPSFETNMYLVYIYIYIYMCCPSVVRITRLLEYMRRAGLPALNSRKKARIRAGESRLSREVSRPTAVGRISKADDVGRDNAHWEGVQTPIDVSYCLSVQISLTRLKYLDDTFPESRLSRFRCTRPAPPLGLETSGLSE